jgi:hypothetical protein
VTLADKDAIDAAINAYNALSEPAKALLTTEQKTKLEALSVAIAKLALNAVIDATTAAKTGVVVNTVAANVPVGTKWVTQAVLDAFTAAIAAAQGVYANAAATKAAIDEAASTLTAATGVFNGAKQDGTNTNITPITSASITALVAPVTGATAGVSGSLTVPDGAQYTVTGFSWTPGDGTFAAATAYTANITLTANAGHQFNSDITPTTNLGTPGASGVVIGSGAGNTLSFKVVFAPTDATAKVVYIWATDVGTLGVSPGAVTINQGQNQLITFTGTGYSDHRWTVNTDTVAPADVTESGTKYTFDSAWRSRGVYTIGLRVKKGDDPFNWYETAITITVE